MLKRYFALMLVMALGVQFSMAQSKTGAKKITLGSITNIGLINGSKASALSLQTIFGVSYKQSFAGIGVGLDYYRFRTVPLFFDLRHEFGKGKRNFFIYGDLGYNFDWLTEKNKQDYLFFGNFDYKGGIYYDAGIGYKVSFKKADALLISTGFSFKKITNEIGTGMCPFVGPCSQEIETYNYAMSRLMIKAGWRF